MNDRTTNLEPIERDDGAGDYLWDRTGAADPEIVRLEQTLATLRYQPSALSASRPRRFRLESNRTPLAAAALLGIAVGGVWMASLSMQRGSATPASMPLRVIDGSPRIGTVAVKGQRVLRAGEWLQTGSDSKAELAVASIGRVTVEPESRLRLIASHQAEHRLELVRGEIEAFITAPPRLFFVDTPSATAVDLGCRYRLHVDDHGSGVLDVTLGWVSLEWDGRESVVPAGTMCFTRPGVGPGTPFRRDASSELKRELERFDFENGGTTALDTVLDEATDDDSVTLWHLLPRAPAAKRSHIVERLQAIQNIPDDVDRSDVMALKPTALERWRNEFMWSPIGPTSSLSK